MGNQGSQGKERDVRSRLYRTFDDSLNRETRLDVSYGSAQERPRLQLGAGTQVELKVPAQPASSSSQTPSETLQRVIGVQEKVQPASNKGQRSSSSSQSSVKDRRQSSSSSESHELVGDKEGKRAAASAHASTHGDPYEAKTQSTRVKHYDKIRLSQSPKSAAELCLHLLPNSVGAPQRTLNVSSGYQQASPKP